MIQPLISTPNYDLRDTNLSRTRAAFEEEFMSKGRASFIRSLVFYSVIIVWLVLNNSYENEIHSVERTLLSPFYRYNILSFAPFLYDTLQFYVDMDLSNLVFLVLGYVFLSRNYINGYMFVIKVLVLNNCRSILQLLLAEERPFWEISYQEVTPNVCLRTYACPDITLFSNLTFTYFGLQLIKADKKGWYLLVKGIGIGFNVLLAVCLIYDGQVYISQAITTYVFFILFERLLNGGYKVIEKVLEGMILYKRMSRKIRRRIFAIILVGIFFNITMTEMSVYQRSVSDVLNYVR